MLLGLGSYIFRYSVGTESFRPERPMGPVELVEQAANLGAGLVQFADNLPLDGYSDEVLDLVRETANQKGIVLEVGTAGAKEDRLLRYLQIAERLNAKLLRITIHAPDTHPSDEEALAVFKAILPKFKNAGITIAIENHFTMTSQNLLSLVDQINDPIVGICLDTANSIVQQEWPMETVQMLSKHAVSLHLKDYKLTAHPEGVGVMITGAPLGAGDQDIDAIMNHLKLQGKDLHMILEQWMPPFETEEATLRNEIEWIRQSIKAARRFIQ
jgi:sugar phosphate isomerase/epimerase